MKRLVLFFLLLPNPLFASHYRMDKWDEVQIYLDTCTITNRSQYEKLEVILRLLQSLESGEKKMVHDFLSMTVYGACRVDSIGCSCWSCCDEIIDEKVQELWGESPCDICKECCAIDDSEEIIK